MRLAVNQHWVNSIILALPPKCGRKCEGGVVDVYAHESLQVPLLQAFTEKKIRARPDSVGRRLGANTPTFADYQIPCVSGLTHFLQTTNAR